MLVASDEMDSLFVRYREDKGYKRRLALLLAGVCQRSEVSTVVSPNLLAFPEDFGHLYYVSIRSYWVHDFYFESHVRECRKISGGWHNIELFSV